MTTTNRRRYERAPAEIACKCRRSANTLYAPAQTINLSPGGAALELTSPRSTQVGDRLALAFNSPTCPILSANKMISATVVRVTPINHDRQHIAVEFDAPQFNLTELISPPSIQSPQRRAA
ncbi:MAG: PilZ domain-containing protein [Phycisphaerales bacterium]|nr:PilZ domain-containing protein [Phycisphaerales bacterium]